MLKKISFKYLPQCQSVCRIDTDEFGHGPATLEKSTRKCLMVANSRCLCQTIYTAYCYKQSSANQRTA